MFDQEDYFNHESLLVITEKGTLKRLKTPFRVLLVVGVNHLRGGQVYLVTAVITNADNMMLYAIDGHSYYYYWFIVLG